MIGLVQIQLLPELPVQLLGQMVDFELAVVVDQTVDFQLVLAADQMVVPGILTDQTAGFEPVVAVDQTVDSNLRPFDS